MNYQNPRFSEIVDHEIDVTVTTLTDDILVSHEREGLKKGLLRDLCRCIEVEISKKKTEKDINILLQKRNATDSKREELQKRVEEKMKVKKISDDKKALYEKILNLYRRNLGFYIGSAKEASDESDITFVFQNINKKNPQETFTISLMTDGLEYKVTSCKPTIDSLDDLVMALNETNNLEKFIIEVRRKFCSVSSMNKA